MPAIDNRHILFVPGKNPKPPPELHREQLWRCLLEGVRRADKGAHAEMQGNGSNFSLVDWNFSYYGNHRDIVPDLPWIEAVLRKPAANAADRREARHWRRHLMRLAYRIGDLLPALIPLIPDPKVKATIAETKRYFDNRAGIAAVVRRPLEQLLVRLCGEHRRVMVIGHSLGSVIAYDVFWTLSREGAINCRVDHFLTVGSPLGTRFVQHRLLGHDCSGRERYPSIIRRWTNLTAVGDLTAFDPSVRDDFSEMMQLGLIEDIQDNSRPLYNAFRSGDGLNVHRSYGYLVNEHVGRVIADWWRSAD